MLTKQFHHKQLPDHSALLCGNQSPGNLAFNSEDLQIWYNNTEEQWVDKGPHYHKESDECFIVTKGSLIVEVEGEQVVVNSREYCCFPKG